MEGIGVKSHFQISNFDRLLVPRKSSTSPRKFKSRRTASTATRNKELQTVGMFSGGYNPPVLSAYPEPQFQPAPPGRQQRPPTYYDPQPPPPPQQIYPRETPYYRSSNHPGQPLRDPSGRQFQVIYYDPNNPDIRPPAPPRAPPLAPVALPPHPASYIEMPSGSNQFRPGDNYTVVAVEENNYRSPARPRVSYEYRGGYNDYQRGYGGQYPY